MPKPARPPNPAPVAVIILNPAGPMADNEALVSAAPLRLEIAVPVLAAPRMPAEPRAAAIPGATTAAPVPTAATPPTIMLAFLASP